MSADVCGHVYQYAQSGAMSLSFEVAARKGCLSLSFNRDIGATGLAGEEFERI